MKKVKKLMITLVAVAAVVFACVSFAACGTPKSEGLYYTAAIQNQGVSYSYKLELFDNGTYEMTYDYDWSISAVALTYGRNVTSYGTYTVEAEDAELNTKNVKLAAPTRIQLCVHHRNGVLLTVDTDAWPAGDPDNGIAAGIEYSINERAETETWETVDEFIAAYGKEYTVEIDTSKGAMVVTVVGEQIPADNAPKKDAA